MSRIRGKDTKPEMLVRRMAHRLGLRFRIHRRDLPGTPDLTFPSRRAVVFVHGCWWHRHPGCKKASGVKTRPDFWQSKFDRNVARDRRAQDMLEALGWKVFTIWECETRDEDKLRTQLNVISQITPKEQKISTLRSSSTETSSPGRLHDRSS
jgi:DNA mismatch endonuclease (patch repair protein)